MTRPIRDLAASIRQRLANLAKERRRPAAELLQYFAMERLLYRLAQSPHRRDFVLKGAMLLVAWRAPQARPTMDIDLLSRAADGARAVESAVRDLCRMRVAPNDGLAFAADSVHTEPITVAAPEAGMRLRFLAILGDSRIRMQVDVGLGDAMSDAGTVCTLPPILDFPAPTLLGYSRETTIAEKLHAMFQHGRLNSRMKDYFDIGLLARHFPFEGDVLMRAIATTFTRRGTAVTARPLGLSEAFAEEPGKQAQWNGFLRRIEADAGPASLHIQLRFLRRFLAPVLAALARGTGTPGRWPPGGPWQPERPAHVHVRRTKRNSPS